MKRTILVIVLWWINTNYSMHRIPGRLVEPNDLKHAQSIVEFDAIAENEVVIVKDVEGYWRYARASNIPTAASWHGLVSFNPKIDPYKSFAVNFKKSVKKLPAEPIQEHEESGFFNNIWKKLQFKL